MKQNIFLVMTLFVALMLPNGAHAYTSSQQTALRVNDTSALFVIDFSFGHGEHDTYIPIFGTTNQENDTKAHTLGYRVIDDEGNEAFGTAALVLSSAKVVDNTFYRVPQGVKQKFTLLVVATVPSGNSIDNYRAEVTDLPFYWDDEMQYLHLNPSELQYYTTPAVE
ncbi:hypothetical protein KC722_01865 [Candidatus Kaiserbacteria bacterium]|nr:hypothetical protein [Candidatus Kaiserbacteria bacterium]MCB9811920.1 hypothetical protein [Candidatus Nomurabacteria bacterium]